MKRAKFNQTVAISVLCISLLANFWLPQRSAGKTRGFEAFDAGELIEAPLDGTVHVSLGGVGSALLASGTKVRLATMNDSALVATVISGDLIVKLQPQSRAFIKAGESMFSTSRGALFHAGLREGKAFVDASDTLRDRISEMGNWAISLPRLESEKPSTPVSQPTPQRMSFKASAQPIGRVESLGLVKINQTSAVRGGLLWGSELIQAPEGSSARATLDGIAQVTLTGGSQARLLTPAIGQRNDVRVLAASLVSGSVVVQLNPTVAGIADAAGATFLAGKGSRFRVMLVEGRAVFEMVEGVGFEKGEWTLGSADSFSKLLASIAPQQPQQPGAPLAARRYIVRPVGLNSNLVVRARSVRQIQVRVTDEDDRPVKGVPIIFSLGAASSGGALGTLGAIGAAAAAADTSRTFTNDAGIASVSFTAAAEAASGSISATVEGTNFSWVGQINLIKVAPGFWSPQNAVPVLTTAAAAAVIGTIKAATKEDILPAKPIGETIIKP